MPVSQPPISDGGIDDAVEKQWQLLQAQINELRIDVASQQTSSITQKELWSRAPVIAQPPPIATKTSKGVFPSFQEFQESRALPLPKLTNNLTKLVSSLRVSTEDSTDSQLSNTVKVVTTEEYEELLRGRHQRLQQRRNEHKLILHQDVGENERMRRHDAELRPPCRDQSTQCSRDQSTQCSEDQDTQATTFGCRSPRSPRSPSESATEQPLDLTTTTLACRSPRSPRSASDSVAEQSLELTTTLGSRSPRSPRSPRSTRSQTSFSSPRRSHIRWPDPQDVVAMVEEDVDARARSQEHGEYLGPRMRSLEGRFSVRPSQPEPKNFVQLVLDPNSKQGSVQSQTARPRSLQCRLGTKYASELAQCQLNNIALCASLVIDDELKGTYPRSPRNQSFWQEPEMITAPPASARHSPGRGMSRELSRSSSQQSLPSARSSSHGNGHHARSESPWQQILANVSRRASKTSVRASTPRTLRAGKAASTGVSRTAAPPPRVIPIPSALSGSGTMDRSLRGRILTPR